MLRVTSRRDGRRRFPRKLQAKSLRARLEKQKADIVVSEWDIAQWQQQLDDTIIRAPFAGIVTSKNAQPGEMISPMSAGGGFTRTGICTLVDMSSLEIEVDVNESYINRVEPGQKVEAMLDSYPDWHIPSKVIAIIPTADRQKATVKVRVGFEKLEPRILPDMGVKVAFQGAEEKQPARRSILIPKTAVQQRDGRDVVWVARDGHVEKRAVTVAAPRGDEVTVSAGLNLDVPRGEFLALMGPSGSGKSTLLNLIGGLDRATRGKVEVGGEPIDRMSDRELAAWRARHVGLVFQFYNLLPVLSAERNVELPLLLTHLSRSQRKNHVEAALTVVGLGHRVKHYPRTMSG